MSSIDAKLYSNAMIYVAYKVLNPSISKIGRSDNLLQRKKKLSSEMHTRIEFYRVWDVGDEVEALLHDYFNTYRLRGEWFNIAPHFLAPEIDYWLTQPPVWINHQMFV